MFPKSSLLDSRKVRTNRKQAAQQPDRAEVREYGGPDQIDRSQCTIHIASGYRWRCCARGDARCGAAFAELDLSTEISTCGSAPRVCCGCQIPRSLGFHWFLVVSRFHAGRALPMSRRDLPPVDPASVTLMLARPGSRMKSLHCRRHLPGCAAAFLLDLRHVPLSILRRTVNYWPIDPQRSDVSGFNNDDAQFCKAMAQKPPWILYKRPTL